MVAAAAVRVAHVLPVNLRVLGHGAGRHRLLRAVGERIGVGVRGNLSLRLVGVFVEVDDLCHRRGGASRSGQCPRAVLLVVLRASQVVGVALVPARHHQLGDAVLCGLHLVAFLDAGVAGLDVVVDDELYLVGIELQPRAHVLGDVVGVERALVHVAEDGFHAVIARHDDVAAIIARIEHIIVGLFALVARGGVTRSFHLRGLGRGELFALGEHEGSGRVSGGVFADGFSFQSRDAGHQNGKGEEGAEK